MEAHQDLVDSLYSHADQQLGFKKPPTLIFQSDPRNYGALSKTAQYDPRSQEITIYVDGRHIKDILRSFAHELVHHHQNEQGRLSGANVTQGEQDFDDIEGEAYHTGNLKLFRKWEDGIKQKNPTIYNERRIYKMSTKKWKNKELSNLMTEKFGYKMDLSKLNESAQEEQLEEVAIKRKDEPAEDPNNVMMNIGNINDYYEKTGKTPSWAKAGLKADAERRAAKERGELEEAAEQLDENGCGPNEEMVEGRCVSKEGHGEEMDEGKGKCACGGPLDDDGKCKGCKSSPEDCKCEKKEAMDEEKEDNVKMVKPDEVDGRKVVVVY